LANDLGGILMFRSRCPAVTVTITFTYTKLFHKKGDISQWNSAPALALFY